MEEGDFKSMDHEYDPKKNKQNIALHRISLQEAERFEFETALIVLDDSEDYGEVRYRGIGFIGVAMYVLVFTVRERLLRAISLRRATKREIREYVEY